MARLTGLLRIADDRLSDRPYLAGDALTVADIVLGHVLFRYHDMDIERPDLPNVAAYYRRLTERPAYRDHVMVSYDELRAV